MRIHQPLEKKKKCFKLKKGFPAREHHYAVHKHPIALFACFSMHVHAHVFRFLINSFLSSAARALFFSLPSTLSKKKKTRWLAFAHHPPPRCSFSFRTDFRSGTRVQRTTVQAHGHAESAVTVTVSSESTASTLAVSASSFTQRTLASSSTNKPLLIPT